MSLLNKNNRRWILPLAFIVALIAILPNPVKALPQRAITLLYFQGTGQNNAILLEWATATEFETAGFIIKRADSESGPYDDLTQIGFIPGEGDGIIGAEYDVIDDDNVVNGQTYWYILVEIENNGNQNPSDPISVVGGISAATATPTQTPTTQSSTNGNRPLQPAPPKPEPPPQRARLKPLPLHLQRLCQPAPRQRANRQPNQPLPPQQAALVLAHHLAVHLTPQAAVAMLLKPHHQLIRIQ